MVQRFVDFAPNDDISIYIFEDEINVQFKIPPHFPCDICRRNLNRKIPA